MDILRQIALREGHTQETSLPLFHSTFLGGIKSKGRIHELSLILRYTIKSGDVFKFKKLFYDMILGLRMFLRGKLVILPGTIKGMGGVKRIFQLTENGLDHGKT